MAAGTWTSAGGVLEYWHSQVVCLVGFLVMWFGASWLVEWVDGFGWILVFIALSMSITAVLAIVLKHRTHAGHGSGSGTDVCAPKA